MHLVLHFVLLALILVPLGCTAEDEGRSGDPGSGAGGTTGDQCAATNDAVAAACNDCQRAVCCPWLEACASGTECATCATNGQSCTAEGAADLQALDDCVAVACANECDVGGDCELSGAVGCDVIRDAWCTRIVQCCTAAGPEACLEWGYDIEACVEEYAKTYDCIRTPYYGSLVCETTVSSCSEAIPMVSCEQLLSDTPEWPSTCSAFWGQF